GSTWSAPFPLGPSCYPGNTAGDGAGNWVLVASSWTGPQPNLATSYSSDDGATWSPLSVLPPDVGLGGGKVVTDGAGTGMLAWIDGITLESAISVDNGHTWSAPVTISEDALDFDLTTDGS